MAQPVTDILIFAFTGIYLYKTLKTIDAYD